MSAATISLADILHDDDIKGVFVSASPQSHFAIASEVIKSGKALFIEKPPCQSEDELLQLISMRKEANFPQVTVGLQKRNAPVIRILKKKLQKCRGNMSYNLKYLTGAYPEGDALLDLFYSSFGLCDFLSECRSQVCRMGKASYTHVGTQTRKSHRYIRVVNRLLLA